MYPQDSICEIENPNSSGQGFSPQHMLHPFHNVIKEFSGWEYSHSTPIHKSSTGLPYEIPSDLVYFVHTYRYKETDWCISTYSNGQKATASRCGSGSETQLHNRNIRSYLCRKTRKLGGSTMKEPQPRIHSHRYNQNVFVNIATDGTWLEAEEFCYPNGGMTRRARVWFRNKLYVVQCGLPDTFFSIPARLKMHRKQIQGFISGFDNNGVNSYKFTPFDSELSKLEEPHAAQDQV